MTLPVTIVSDVGLSGDHPPVLSKGGAFYAVLRADADELDVYKATDPTSSFAVQDSSNGPVHVGTILGYGITVDDNIIHMVVWDIDTYEYWSYDMDTDQWVVDQLIEVTGAGNTSPPLFPWATIVVRSTGDVIVFYAGTSDKIMGNSRQRVVHNIRTGSTWGGPVALDAAGEIHYGNPTAIKGPLTDDIHALWQQTNGASFTGYLNIEARTIDPANALSTIISRNTEDTGSILLGMANAVAYDDAGTQRMIFAGVYSVGTALVFPLTSEDGSDDIQFDGGTNFQPTADPFANLEVGLCSITEINGVLHVLYVGGGASGIEQDLHYTTSTDNGVTWAPRVEEIDLVTIDWLSTSIYCRGSDVVLAYLYDEGGVQKYNEKILANGICYLPYPFMPRRPNVLLRM